MSLFVSVQGLLEEKEGGDKCERSIEPWRGRQEIRKCIWRCEIL
jgi:hypothetical protein